MRGHLVPSCSEVTVCLVVGWLSVFVARWLATCLSPPSWLFWACLLSGHKTEKKKLVVLSEAQAQNSHMFNVSTLQQLKQVTVQIRSITWGNRFISWREELQSRVLGKENRVAILAIDGSIQTIFQSHTRLPQNQTKFIFLSWQTLQVCKDGLFCCLFLFLSISHVCLSFRERKNSSELSAMRMKTSWGAGPCQRPWNLLGDNQQRLWWAFEALKGYPSFLGGNPSTNCTSRLYKVQWSILSTWFGVTKWFSLTN